MKSAAKFLIDENSGFLVSALGVNKEILYA